MKFLLILVAVVLAVVLFRFLRSSEGSARKGVTARGRAAPGRGAAQASGRYHAVSIKCGPGACAAARALGQKRLLSSEITQFPLPDCTTANCQCKFVHHDDRRDEDSDKRAPTALRSELYSSTGKPERRTGSGRRKTDQD